MVAGIVLPSRDEKQCSFDQNHRRQNSPNSVWCTHSAHCTLFSCRGQLKGNETMTSQRKVEHDYKDHAGAMEDPDNSSNGSSTNNKAALQASDRNFPVKLHFMLSELDADGLSHVISWQPHGRCFVVHKQDDFVKTVLPMYVSWLL
jgi:HSF-type DNA-binding